MHLSMSCPTYHTLGKRGALDRHSEYWIRVPRGESFARWLLKELKCELQYEILVACITRNSTKIRLVVWPEVWRE